MKELKCRNEVGPPIDVMTTLSTNLHDSRELLNAIHEYLEDVRRVSAAMKDIALMNSNMAAYASAQSAIDVTKDVQDLLDGKKITTLREMDAQQKKDKQDKEDKEKELEAKRKEDDQQSYLG